MIVESFYPHFLTLNMRTSQLSQFPISYLAITFKFPLKIDLGYIPIHIVGLIININRRNIWPAMIKIIAIFLLFAFALSCPSNCNDCDPQATICFACAEGFEMNVLGTCVDSNTVPKCTLYGPTNQCFACQPTFTINNGQCLKDYSACL